MRIAKQSSPRRLARVLACVLASGLLLGWAGLVEFAHGQQTQGAAGAELQMLPVQGNVYLLAGAGGNIAVQIGQQGTLVVDTGLADRSDAVLAAIRKLTNKPIQYILNTHVHADHTGGNDAMRRAGTTIAGANVTGNLTDVKLGAQIFAHDNVLMRMSAPTGKQSPMPFGSWPTQTFFGEKKQMSFNGEPIEMLHQPAAHTDGDSIVFFRGSDVLATGDIFTPGRYPIVDLARGGTINGLIDALNRILEIAVPEFRLEGGTYMVPGHGRLTDSADVAYYRDMATIIRDRIQDAIKQGKTLDQIKDAKLTLDYDGIYGATTGIWTTDMFIEAVYKSLTQKK